MARASLVVASTVPVSVEGGPDGLGSTYHWTITNHHTSPIIRVEIPHYRASLFFVPKGWTSSCTNLVGVGVPDAPGICTATATTSGDAIGQGRSTTFNMQLASGSVKRGHGDIVVGLADSTTHKIGGVSVPIPETFGDRYIPLLGLGTILVVFFAIQFVRNRKKQRLLAEE